MPAVLRKQIFLNRKIQTMEQVKTGGHLKTAMGGIFLSIIGNLTWQDLLRTVVLGIVGTAASFFASKVLKKLFKKR